MMHKKLKVTLLTLVILHALVRCSKVIEKGLEEKVPYDYCQRIGVCAEGTHVMCTHFKPNATMGPLCLGTRNVSINAEYAQLLLDLLNVIRSRTARNKSAGLDNLTLPRGYGMFRLQWDPELSTIAQVWANTCTIGPDMCHATETFPDPGQVLGITRFDENWLPLNAKSLFNYSGFSLDKVKYGIQSTVRSWYRARGAVHPDDISNVNFKWPKYLTSNSFLKIVHGRTTHVGCGISVFVEFHYKTSKDHIVNLFYNVVRVVCNLSSRLISAPRKDRVYTTEPPTQQGYTVRCGCPIGYDEDEYCLCYESNRKLTSSIKGKEVKPAVVVLPIFTVENAPPSKINLEFRNESSRKMMESEVYPDPEVKYIDNTRPRRHNLRGSIFLKPSIFELPPRKLKTSTENGVIADVIPRRDFSNVRRLVTKYLNERRRNNAENDYISIKTIENIQLKSHNVNKATHYNNMKKENFEDPTKRNIVYDTLTRNTNTDMKISSNSNRLMSLLNKLEEEAKFVQLAFHRKNELDHKIRKIYSTFLENAFSSPKSTNRIEVTEKMVTFHDFLENDRLNKYEEQFNAIRENEQERFIYDKNPILSKQKLISNNSFTYNRNRDTLGIGNIHGLRNNQNIKMEESKDFNNENSLLMREDDILTLEKRKFYQDKLNNLERRLRDFNNNRNRNKLRNDQHMRRMLPHYHELQGNR